MKRAGGVAATAAWGKSHWILVSFLLLCAVLIVMISWYSLASVQQASRAVPIVSASPPLPLAAALATNVFHVSTIQATVQNSGGHSTAPVTTQVQVNGQSVQASPTGIVHKVIQDPNGTTTVDISVDSTSPNNSSSLSSTSINLQSTSEVTSTTEGGQQVP